jgi:hypothetical protein
MAVDDGVISFEHSGVILSEAKDLPARERPKDLSAIG